MALPLAMIGVGIAMTLSLTFLASQATSTTMSRNLVSHSVARAIAESGLTLAITYIKTDPNWRTAQTNGAWLADHSFGGGTFAIRFEDEADGDLTDDDTEPVIVTAIGKLGGVTHKVAASVTPGPPPIGVLFVVPNPASLGAGDQARKAKFESWGMTV